MSSIKDATARKNEQVLMELLKEESNKHCADCGQKGTRWASWNLGVFLCIRCGGLHRRLGTHISRVKSVNLDKWTDEQVQVSLGKVRLTPKNMINNGNGKVNAIYNPNPDRFQFPSYSGDMEQYIRDKYERKLFMSTDARSHYASAVSTQPKAGSQSQSGRYPLQMKSLQEMGFTDAIANQAALLSTSGNLQQAVEALLSGRAGNLGFKEEQTEETLRKSSPAEDLASIFGTSIISSTTAKSQPSIANTSSSILDMDFPPPPTMSSKENLKVRSSEVNNAIISDEFEEFESAPVIDTQTSTFHLGESRKSLSSDNEKPIKVSTQVRPLSSIDPALSNPWASNNSGASDAFDDIDPFRGFASDHRAQ